MSLSGLSLAPTDAAVGINKQINFQGKLVNTDGTNIPDGTYNMEFKIYQDGDGVPGGADETLKWTETRLRNNSQGVTVTDGIFQVNLGSVNATLDTAVDWHQSVLWLSINLGNTNATCTPFSTCAPDGEMNPMIRFTAVPQAFNADKLDNLDSSAFGQLAANQTWTGTNTLQPTTNITGLIIRQNSSGTPTADILNVQTANGSSNFIQITGPAANEGAVTIQSIGATRNLTLNSGSGTITTNASTLQRTAAGTTTIDLNDAANTTLSVTNSGTGAASISLAEAGSYTGAAAVTLSSGGAGALSLDSASGTIELLDNTDLNNNTLQGGTAAIDFTNFDVSSTGTISTDADLVFRGAGNVARTVRKNMTVTSAVTANDVVIIDTATAGQVTTTATAASNKVFGIATATNGVGVAQDIVTGGVYQVTAVTADAIAIGDFLVTSTTAGAVTASASPAAGTVLGRALSAKAAAVAGTVWVYVTPGIGGSGGSGANTALSNLDATTAINSSLLPGTGNSIDLGSAANSWRNLYIGTSIQTAAATDLALQPTTGIVAINRAATANELRVYENAASPTRYVSILYNTISTSAGQLVLQSGDGVVSLGTTSLLTAGGTLIVDSASGTALNLGTGANAHNVTVGNTTGTSSLTLNAGSGNIVIGAATIQRSATSLTLDLINAANSTFSVTNSGAGVASVSIEAGGSYTGAGAVTLSSGGAGALSLDSASGTVGIAAGDSLSFLGTGNVVGTVRKNMTVTSAVTANDAVIIDTATAGQVTTTATAASNKVFGIATAANAAGVAQDIVTGGVFQVTAVTADAIAIGDFLVTSTTAGAVTASASPAAGTVLGRALSAKAAAVAGTVWVYVTPGIGGSGAGGSTTLQQAYDNSTSPATITTSSAAKDIVFKSGSGFNSDNMFQVQDAAGAEIFAVDTTDGNLITNGSFETDTSGWAAKGSATLSRDLNQLYIGRAALNVTTTAAAGDGAKFNVTLESTVTYSLSLYAKAGTSFSTFEIGRSEDGTADSSCLTAQTVATAGWTRFSCTFTTGATSGTTYIYAKQTDATARTFYLDAVQLESGDVATAYREGALLLNGVVTSPIAFQNSFNSTTAFQVRNRDGYSVFTIDTLNKGLITLQPAVQLSAAANSTATHITQTLTNIGSAIGNQAVGYHQNITVSNSSGSTQTTGQRIEITDNTALGNTALGLEVSILGTNPSQKGYAVQAFTERGIGVRGRSEAAAAGINCGGEAITASIGVCGWSEGVGGDSYGGYFVLTGGGSGASLFATNRTSGNNILQLQDATGSATDVFLVADGGAVTITPKGNNIGTTIRQTTGTATSGNVLAVQTANGSSNFIQITNAAANEGAVTIQSVGATRQLTLQSGSGTVTLGTSTALTASGALAVRSGGATVLTVDAGGAANLDLGTTNANAVNISKTGAITTVQGTTTFNEAATVGNGAGNDYLGFAAEGTNPACAAGNYRIWANSTDLKLKKCQNGTVEDLDTTGGAGSTTLQQAYDNGGGVDPEIVLTAADGVLTIRDNATPLGTNLFEIQNNAATTTFFSVSATGTSVTGTFLQKSDSATAFRLQDTSGNDSLVFDISASELKVYENVASPTAYASISYVSGEAIFKASTGTTKVGSGSGPITISAGAGAAVTITGNAASTWSTTAGTLTVQGGSGTVSLGTTTSLTATGALTLQSGTSAALTLTSQAASTWSTSTGNLTILAGSALFLDAAAASIIRIGDATNNMTFAATTREPTLNGTARHSRVITLSPEYAGATLSRDGSATFSGTMISDNAFSGNAWRNYYEWTSTNAALQDYTIMVRVTLPQDWDGWETGSCPGATCALEIAYATGLTTVADNAVSLRVNNAADTPATAICTVADAASATAGVWTSFGCASTTLDSGTPPEWDAAGETAVLRIKVKAKSTASAKAQAGDITLRYKSKW